MYAEEHRRVNNMQHTKQTARNILIMVNAVIASGAIILKIVDPIVVSYTEEIRKADLLNFLVFAPIIMVILSFLLYRALDPVVRLSGLGVTMNREQAQELRTAAFNLPLKVLFLFNLIILSIVGFVALGFDAVFFPFYPFYKRFISMGLIWSYTICSSMAVYVYVKRRMVPVLRSTSGLAADEGRRTSIRISMVAATVTLSAMILLFLSVYGYSKTREALIRDDEEAANALLYSVKQKTAAYTELDSLKRYLASRRTDPPVYLVAAEGAYLTGSPKYTGDEFSADEHAGRTPAAMIAAGENQRTMMKLLPLGGRFNGFSLAAVYTVDTGKIDAMRNITLFFLVIGFFFLIFSGIISYSVASETSFALADIEERMRRIAENKETLYKEFEVVSLDEVGDLTRSFNNLQRAIHSQNMLVKELEEKKHRIEKGILQKAVDKATASLLESELKFRTLAETTTAGIFIHRNGRVMYANPASETITGYTNTEFLSMEFHQIFHPDDRDAVLENGHAHTEAKKIPVKCECRILRKDGDMRWVNIASGSIEYEEKAAVLATVFDITDRRKAEEEKVNLYEERIAEEKRHVIEKENILMDLHDGIGGITTNISILAELARNASDIDSVKNTLSTISRLSREGMIEIRGFMQSLDTREMNWRTLAAELRNQGAKMMEPYSIVFSIEISLDDNHDRPESVLWANIFKIYKEALTNVIKHAKASSVAVALTLTGSEVQLVVRDDGTGCKQNTGHGRGLSNMKKRAAEVGGTLTLFAEKGTSVYLKIPLPLRFPEV